MSILGNQRLILHACIWRQQPRHRRQPWRDVSPDSECPWLACRRLFWKGWAPAQGSWLQVSQLSLHQLASWFLSLPERILNTTIESEEEEEEALRSLRRPEWTTTCMFIRYPWPCSSNIRLKLLHPLQGVRIISVANNLKRQAVACDNR